MQSLGLEQYRASLVWMLHCAQTRVTEAQLREFSQFGGAIAPEKVRIVQAGLPAALRPHLVPCSCLDELPWGRLGENCPQRAREVHIHETRLTVAHQLQSVMVPMIFEV